VIGGGFFMAGTIPLLDRLIVGGVLGVAGTATAFIAFRSLKR
jgi:hypothetical protein